MSREIKGIEDLTRKLNDLDKKLRNRTITKAIREGAKVISVEAKKEVPVATGELRKSIKVRSGKRRKNKISIEVQVKRPYVGSIEYGNEHQEPEPFLRPSFEKEKDEVRRDILDKIAAEVRRLR